MVERLKYIWILLWQLLVTLKLRCQMPWSGNPEILISQYDVRVHLETIPDYSKLPKPQLSAAEYAEEMKCNYERYRNLVINLYQEVSEEDYLKRLNIEEMYPKQSALGTDKDKISGKAAIGYSYGDSVADDYNISDNDSDVESIHEEEVAQLSVDDLTATDIDKLNLCALEFKISAGYFGRMLHEEKSYQSQQQYARQMAAETRHLHGKHAKRERRLFRESRRFSHVQTTPPSYAQRDSPTYEPYESNDRNQSRSRSSTPEAVQSKVEYITEFGTASDHDEGRSSNKNASDHSRHRSSVTSPHSSTHRYRSPPRYTSSNSRRRSRSRSHSRERHRRHRRSRSRDSERRRYRSRSSSTERYSYKSYSRSKTSYHRSSHSNSRSRTRSKSPPHHSRSRYHRSRSSSSDSSSSSSSSSRTPSPVKKRPAKPSTSEKESSSKKPAGTKSKMTPQERLQKKLQLQLNKQLKQDKKTQKMKANIKAAEQMEREDDLREQARKWKSRDAEGYYRD